MRRRIHISHGGNKSGFTLIEMIGILAIIAILVAALSPRVFDAISDSRITGFSSFVNSIKTSVTSYYTDLGTLFPIDDNGAPKDDASGANLPNIMTGVTAAPSPVKGLWGKFRGPYLEKFSTSNPPLGVTMNMPSIYAKAGNLKANNANNYDLNNDGNADFSSTTQLVTLLVEGISEKEFTKLDKIIDEGIGSTDDEMQNRGRVKWHKQNGGTVRIYIAHK